MVKLEWMTAVEINNDYFTTERTVDGRNFETVSNVAGAGNSSRITSYTDTDKDPRPGKSYYRLKQTDFDGQFAYSDLVAVDMDQADARFRVYPSPAGKEWIQVQISGVEDAEITINIINTVGKLVISTPVLPTDKRFSTLVNTSLLPDGIYFLVVNSVSGTFTRKLVIQ